MSLTANDSLTIIPKPAHVEMLDGNFTFPTTTLVHVASSATASADAVALFGREFDERLQIHSTNDPAKAAVRFLPAKSDCGAEGYILAVTPDSIVIEASLAAGWFYGVQTLIQLLPPPDRESQATQENSSANSLTVPCVRIVDQPRLRWRGLMLDVSRHLMPVDGILRLLDTMAAHKLNTFHWHLTDDQGWRIESRRFPRLTEIGAWRRGADGVLVPGNQPEQPPQPGRYGGFYSHDDVRTVVAFARARSIRVVPEIEMPGHAVAAVAAYPHLSCTGAAFETATRTGVFNDVYCAGNDATFDLLEGVLDEIIPLFPDEFFHVGGDECPKTRWHECPKCQARIKTEGLKDEHELQSYVIRRMEKFLAARGKRLIGWEEILEGGLPPLATVMSWRGISSGITAANAGHDAVMSPKDFCYFDYRQAQSGEPYAIGNAVITLEEVYSYDPIPPELDAKAASHILGIQGNVWTEYMPDMRHVEYMIWPRAAALAEVAWAPAGDKNLDDFLRRVKANEPRLSAKGSNFRRLTT